MKKSFVLAVVVGSMALAGCSGNNEKGTAAAPNATTATVENPTDIPLGADAKILDAKPFNQNVTNSHGPGGTLLSQGAGSYRGHSIIAQSTAPLADVKTWLKKLESAPPAGYSYVSNAEHPDAVALAAKNGISYAVFKRGAKGAVVAVIDPKMARAKIGVVLSLVDKYRMLPPNMRGPIDDAAKKRTGMSVSEALDQSAPLGMTIAALRSVNGSDNPAIVVVDATKE